MIKVLMVFGTRPEAIKMAPLYFELKNRDSIDVRICVTSQHREMLDQVLEIFQIVPEYDLDIMKKSRSLHESVSIMISSLPRVFDDFDPKIVLVHGDTASTLATTIAAFYSNILVGHVEAGLRTGDLKFPWPEEGNRKLVGAIANLHFCPTSKSQENLLAEGVLAENVYVTGNTVIDALKMVVLKHFENSDKNIFLKSIDQRLNGANRIILVTGHRRENFGSGILQICEALKKIAIDNSEVLIVYPIHLNPNIKHPVKSMLANVNNILLLPPLSYVNFVGLMYFSTLILTDSGGIQEEGPSLGKPVLVMRDLTERPEAVEAGTVKLIGRKTENIVRSVNELLADQNLYKSMANSQNPYGDGQASIRISNILEKTLVKK